MNVEFAEPPAPSSAAQDFPPTEAHLADYWAVVVKRHRLIVASITLALLIGVAFSMLSRPTYKATTVLDIEREKGTAMDISSTPAVYPSYDLEFLPTQTRLMKSREIAERVVRRLNLAGNLRSGKAASPEAADLLARAASDLQGHIDVKPIRGTNLVELSFVGLSPKAAADVANAIADAYIDWNIESKFQVLGQASQFLSSQIEQVKGEIDEKERQLQAYSRQKDIVSIDPQSNVTTQRLESLNRDYANAVADRVAKEARYHEVSTARPDSIADTLSNGLVSQLRNEQAKMEREYAEKLNLFKPEWPAMQQLNAQIDKGRQHLDSVIEETVAKARDIAKSDYETALRREESLKGVLQGQKSEAMTQNTNAVEYNNLRVEVETKRALLDTLLKRNAETQVNSRLRGERLSNIRVVDRALPPGARFRPSYTENLRLSLLFGCAFGIAVAFLLEYLDRSLRSPEQVEKILRLPALGVIPAVHSSRSARAYGAAYGYGARLTPKTVATADENIPIELLPHDQPRSTVAEAYRAFRTALLLSKAGGVNTFAITSSMPAEGKTSTALNLAIVLGQLGKRVLIIDGDLHKPRMHELLRLSKRVGLVSILAENVAAASAVQNTAIPNVFAITAGPNSPNPSGLLASEGMKKLLESVRANFDYVVIDTPPVSPVADAIVLGNQVDGVVLTVRGGWTPREQVTRTRDKLIRSNVKILGVLINNLEDEPTPYGRYYPYSRKRSDRDQPYAETPRVAASR